MRSRDAGAALLTAMIVVLLATSAAVAMASRQQIDIRRTANLLQWDQARQHALGVEVWAAGVLGEDVRASDFDAYSESWGRPLPPTAIEGGQLAGRIEDLQGRFNINELWDQEKVDETSLARFRRLLELLDIGEGVAEAAVDWLDPDVQPRGADGAEDDFYLRRDPPYRSANAPMTHASELRLVRGMTEEHYRRLAPFVTALPARAGLNVNTAPAELLMMLDEDIGRREAQRIVEGRKSSPFEKTTDFLRHDSLAGHGVNGAGLSAASAYFRVHAHVRVDRVTVQLRSTLFRDEDGGIRVLAREHGRFTDG